jgi:hypothetical protein
MKNLVSITAFAGCLLAFIHCQAQEIKPVQFGVVAGLNITNLYTTDAISNVNAGFNAGVFVRAPLTNSIALEPELYVSTKGASVAYNSLIVNGTANFNLTYLEMPLICIINVTHLVNVQVGPYVSYLLDGKVKNVANINLFNFEQNLNVNDYNRIDAGVVVGAGLDVGAVTMGLRYNLGLTKVGKTQSFLGTSYTIPDANNAVLNFYISIGLK